MTNSLLKQVPKRNLLILLALVPWLAGCSRTADAQAPDTAQRKFRGIGPALVVDAVADAEMEEVVLYDDRGVQLFTRALVSKRNSSTMGLARVPLTVHVVWRKGTGWDKVRQVWNDGVVAGDYTIPVGARIPGTVLNEIRAHGGGLRLKFRLKPDGVLFGWDITRKAPLGDVSIFEMPGGDFLETRY